MKHFVTLCLWKVLYKYILLTYMQFYSAVLLHLWIGMQLEICFLCDVCFVSLPPPAGEWDPNRAGGADITGAGAAPADRHRERRNWASACGDRRYTEVRGDTLVQLSNLLNIIMNYHNHVISVGRFWKSVQLTKARSHDSSEIILICWFA